MDFELSEDQVAFRDAASELLDGYASPPRVRETVDAGGGIDQELWKAMVEQGWPGLAVPESSGGLGFGTIEAAVLLEQTGAHVASSPFLQQVVALDAVVRAAAAGAPVDEHVEALVSGASIATVSWRTVDARQVGDSWTLSGRTEPALFAPSASVVVVPATEPGDDGGTGLFLVALDDEARPPAEAAMDLTRQVGWLQFDDTPAVRLGGEDAATGHLDLGATAHAAEMLGAGARALDMSVEYAKDRQQFGRPIGSFQAVKHRCADMLVDVEGMRSAVYYAAWAIGAGDSDASVAASTAKTWCSDASKRVMSSMLQVHGGIGFTWEHDAHLYLKRAQLDQVCFGDATFHRARLASLLRQRIEAGDPVL